VSATKTGRRKLTAAEWQAEGVKRFGKSQTGSHFLGQNFPDNLDRNLVGVYLSPDWLRQQDSMTGGNG